MASLRRQARWWCAAVLASLAGAAAAGGLLADGQPWRVLPLTLRDGKPMVAATVAGRTGVLMLDNGTPDALFLNRDALPNLSLAPGAVVGQGQAASGQAITVQQHPAPGVSIAGQPLVHPAPLRSGNFGFTRTGLGDDFLGFIGTPMVEGQAFVLDLSRRRLMLMQPGADGALPVPAPAAGEVLVALRFLLWPGGLPLLAGQLGGTPILVDVDTGDGGTLYATPALQARLLAAGALQAAGVQWRLRGLALGGMLLDDTTVQVVDAGGPQDHRRRQTGQPDLLRLGAAFLARHPSLWNFPARTLTLLKPDAAWLRQLDTAPGAAP